jgi:seryl-tRNA synthetase
MLEIKFLRQNLTDVKQALSARQSTLDVDDFKSADDQRRRVLIELEELRHLRNRVSDQIAALRKDSQEAAELIEQMRAVSAKVKTLEQSLAVHEDTLAKIMLEIPNIPHASVPIGKDAGGNLLVRRVGTPPDFDFEAQAHWDLGKRLGILDFERAAKVAGARFPLYIDAGARLERALINFMLDVHVSEHGYTEVLPPFAVNRQSMINTGQLPKFQQDLFKLEGWDYFMIPTAEVPLTNLHQGEVLEEAQLPIFYTAYTPCFRSEAGSYGKDTRGLIRQHQFNKVEMVKLTQPELSYDELEKMLINAEAILRRLALAYQVVSLCTGDMGFSAAKTYDIEVWMPGQGTYREISSCSNCESFQARRANIRFRRKGKKGTELVHTLNGSGLAVGRTVAAILENFQQADGSVIIPERLRDYLGGMDVIAP